MLSRRHFGLATASWVLTGLPVLRAAGVVESRFQTRGVVLFPWDLSLSDWPERAARAGITTIGLHAARRLDVLSDFVRSDQGLDFLERCRKLNVQVEYELHAMGDLLSRELYYQDTDLFRVDDSGQRTIDFNCCPSSTRAVEIIAEQAVEVARVLTPTTGRYFYWPDDGREWCHCEKCKGLSPSEQAVLVENAIVTALRREVHPEATVGHLAYQSTIDPPRLVQPHPGLFVEFAPIHRVYDRSIADPTVTLEHSSPDPQRGIGTGTLICANRHSSRMQSRSVLAAC